MKKQQSCANYFLNGTRLSVYQRYNYAVCSFSSWSNNWSFSFYKVDNLTLEGGSNQVVFLTD